MFKSLIRTVTLESMGSWNFVTEFIEISYWKYAA